MKRRLEVDDIFKQKLANHSVPAPPYMWERIAKARENRPAPRWWAGRLVLTGSAAILTLALAAAWWLYQQPVPAGDPVLGNFYLSPVAISQDKNAFAEPGSPAAMPAVAVPPTPIYANTAVQSPANVQTGVTSLTTELAVQGLAAQTEGDPVSEEKAIVVDAAAAAPATGNKSRWSPPDLLPTLTFDSPPLPLPQYIKCARFGGSTWRFHLEVVAAPELPMREFRPRQAEALDYARLRQQTESADFAVSAALRLALVSESGFVLKTGLHYGQVNENFSFFNPNEQRIIITDIYGSDGHLIRTDTIVVNGAEYKADNRYQWLDIPLLAGYEMDFGKLTFALNAGAHINMLLDAKGQFMSPEDLQRPIGFDAAENAAGQAFRHRIGVGWYASMGILYHVKPGWQLLFEPGFRIYPRSLTRSHFEVDQRYFISGINVGVRRAL